MVINHFTEVEQYRIYRVLLEVYKTDEENWEQYIPLNGSDEKTDNETIKVTLEMNFIQNIATMQPMSAEEDKGEEIFDKQTDRSAAGG